MKLVTLLRLKKGGYEIQKGIRYYLPSCGSYNSFTNYEVEEELPNLLETLTKMKEEGLAENSEKTCRLYTTATFKKVL